MTIVTFPIVSTEARRHDVWYEIPIRYPDCLKNPPDTQFTSYTQEQIDEYR